VTGAALTVVPTLAAASQAFGVHPWTLGADLRATKRSSNPGGLLLRPNAQRLTPNGPNAQRPTPSQGVRYNRDIRPILAENCFACHGPDSAARKADLRLDRFADATASRNGHAAIVKGNPAASELVRRITGNGPVMPPAATHKKLTPQQIATLKQWIAAGAEYEKHWSYLPPQRPALPAVNDANWVRNPIDRFVLARLEAAGLKPASEADPYTLIRRLSLDLRGLPPTPEEVDEFIRDCATETAAGRAAALSSGRKGERENGGSTSPTHPLTHSPTHSRQNAAPAVTERAYEKLVDRFLASPQWGEHRGRYWLDAARYADTHGIHFDNFRENWAYREWVINAFNRNVPFDQFTIEQLAGDLLPKPTLDQVVASGFNRCNMTTNEGGAIAEEYLVYYTRDRTETTAQVWLGTTAGCAVCHDHKFDPLSQRDFYAMSAFFNNTTQAAMDGNIKDTPPVIPVPLPGDRERLDAIKPELAAVKQAADTRKQSAQADFDRWMGTPDASSVMASVPTHGLRFHAPLTEGKGRELAATLDGKPLTLTAAAEPGWAAGHVSEKGFQRRPGSSVEIAEAGDFEKDQPFTVAAWVKLSRPGLGGSLVARMDDQHDFRGWDVWIENGRVGTHLINRWPEDAMKVITKEDLKAGQWQHVCVTYSGSGNTGGLRIYIDGVVKQTDDAANSLKSTIRTTVPFKIGQRHSSSGVDGTGIQDVRLYGRALAADEVSRLVSGTRAAWLASRGAAQLPAGEKDELFRWWLTGQDESYRTLAAKISALENEERMIRARGTIAHVMSERPQEPMAFVLFRGDYDKRRDAVKPAIPASLPPMPESFPNNRLGFAKWLLMPEHPLTARVTVNRFWQEVFGNGIVRTAGDFGIAGELPSHPELLDWLAVEFRETGWDMKAFFKLLVMSATYRQAAVTTPEKRDKDPQNRWLSRGPRFRLDAEVIRDYALASSGILTRKLGGPSARPYQPEGVWEAVAMIGSNTRNYQRDTVENLYRRSMYTFWKRAAPPASMDILNAPSREVCAVRRERTNTPLQALVTLNDPQFVEAARFLAEKALKEGGTKDDDRIDFIAHRLLTRPFRAEEKPVVLETLAELLVHYQNHVDEARKLIAVGESKADAMNLDEVLNK
jgi:mono/diheme cytochrome c family protein